MILSGYCSVDYIERLQKYSKSFAKSLRFIELSFCTHSEKYNYRYSIDVQEQNKIDELELELLNKLTNKHKKVKNRSWNWMIKTDKKRLRK